jgi:hypothetical protein
MAANSTAKILKKVVPGRPGSIKGIFIILIITNKE